MFIPQGNLNGVSACDSSLVR